MWCNVMCAYMHNFTHCTCWVAKRVSHSYMYWGMFCKIMWVLFRSVELFFLSIKKKSFCATHLTHMCTVISLGFQALEGGKMYEWLHWTNNQRHIFFCPYMLAMDHLNFIPLIWFAWNLMRMLCHQSSLQSHEFWFPLISTNNMAGLQIFGNS
jgi:hypothetical protein